LEGLGEMFEIAVVKSLDDQGVIGSTWEILKFNTRKVQESTTATPVATNIADDAETSYSTIKRLRFVGAEAGVVTLIVKNVQDILGRQSTNVNGNNTHQATEFGGGSLGVEVEIIFPVSAEVVMTTDSQPEANSDLPIAPEIGFG
jgi:hypothetical protein